MKTKQYVYATCFDDPDAEQKIMGDSSVPEADMSWYFQRCLGTHRKTKIKPLTAAQERVLFLQYNYARWRACSSTRPDDESRWGEVAEAKKVMILEHNLALVLSMVKRYTPASNMSHYDDFVNECNQRLLRSIELFDVDRGWKFSTYACSAIINHVRRLSKKAYASTGSEMFETLSPSTDPVADRRRTDSAEDLEKRIQAVRDAIKTAGLSKVERFVIERRFLDRTPMTLAETGAAWGFSKERARQVQISALTKIKQAIIVSS